MQYYPGAKDWLLRKSEYRIVLSVDIIFKILIRETYSKLPKQKEVTFGLDKELWNLGQGLVEHLIQS